MLPVVATKQLVAAQATGICLLQTPIGAGDLVMNGALVTGGVAVLDTQRRILFTSIGNDSGITFFVEGTNGAGTAITETVTGANAGTVATLQDFATVTEIDVSGAVAVGGVTVGTNGVGSTQWFIPNPHLDPVEVAASLQALSGTANVTVEVTDNSPLMLLPIYQPGWNQVPPIPVPFGWLNLTVVTPVIGQAIVSDINRNCAGIRLTINSGTGNIQMTLRQAGIVVG